MLKYYYMPCAYSFSIITRKIQMKALLLAVSLAFASLAVAADAPKAPAAPAKAEVKKEVKAPAKKAEAAKPVEAPKAK
jgi:hypothetical protein